MSITSEQIRESAKTFAQHEKERLKEIERNESRIGEIGSRVEEIDQAIAPLEIERKKLLEEYYQIIDQPVPSKTVEVGRSKRDTTPQDEYDKAVNAFFSSLNHEDGVKTSQVKAALEAKGMASIMKIRVALDKHKHEGERANRVYFKQLQLRR